MNSLLVFALFSFLSGSPGLYVSPTGSDYNPGTKAKPFATIERARDAIRALKVKGELPKNGITVEILGGKYSLDHSLEFTEVDSGTADAPVTYRAYQNQRVELVGGRVVKMSDFAPVTDPALASRLDPSACGKVVFLSLKPLGIKHAGPFPQVFGDSGGLLELFWDGHRLPISRWPNTGWIMMKRAVVNGDAHNPGTFEYRDERPSRWLQNPDIWLKGQWRVPWEDPTVRVAKIDPARHLITFAAGIQAGIGNKYTRPAGNGKEPWCALNLIEEIDQPGEWAIDFSSQTLFFWPPAEQGELLISQLDTPMIAMKGTSHLRVVGLTLEASLGDGVLMQGVDSCLVAGCTLRNLAKRGVTLTGYRSRVQSCDMFDLGEGCIYVNGGDKKKLIPSENGVINNHLHHYGVLKAMYSPAIDTGFGGAPNGIGWADSVGVLVAHNLIHDAPRDAVLVSGQDNVFEYNEIFNCGFGSGDLGAFYSWLDWTIRVTIRYNYIHDTIGGVNPDDGAAGNTVFGNVFVGPRVGVWIASGPDHTTQNNIFIKDEGPVFGMDDRGLGRGYATHSRLHKAVANINPAQPPWSTRFPEMATLLENHPELPQRTKVTRNVIVIKKGEPYVLKMNKANRTNSALFAWSDNFVTAQDPGFVDATRDNYELRGDSIVFKQIPGFEPIPFRKIGLMVDEYRRRLPTDREAGRDKLCEPRKGGLERNFST